MGFRKRGKKTVTRAHHFTISAAASTSTLVWFFKTGFLCVTESWLPWNSLCRSGWPQTHRNPPPSASQVVGPTPRYSKTHLRESFKLLSVCLSREGTNVFRVGPRRHPPCFLRHHLSLTKRSPSILRVYHQILPPQL